MSCKTPGEVRARTCGTKSPSRSEALMNIDKAIKQIHSLKQTNKEGTCQGQVIIQLSRPSEATKDKLSWLKQVVLRLLLECHKASASDTNMAKGRNSTSILHVPF